ncbi:MAG: DNA methyltransferase [Gammaproteobacteria bacterium]|nr:DNA methyltransferase [Gammaproteobacteria bacterium]
MKKNTLYYGDCLEVMEEFDERSVDLIYLDPPFNSKADYNIIFGTQRGDDDPDDLAQLTAFTDTWEWDADAQRRVDSIMSAIAHPAHRAMRAFKEIYPDGSGMLSYLSYMAERLAVMPRLLKNSGSIYLHCDPTASHYLKLIMDEVFGKSNFRNEIVWGYKSGGATKKWWAKKHDVLFYYAKNAKQVYFQTIKEKSYNRDFKPYRFKGVDEYEDETGWYTLVNMKDVWQIDMIGRTSAERLGYPTQKPLALLKRIITASSDQGGLVLDPFCGCGTTVEAAHQLKRDWIGIDISSYAIEVIRRERMKDMRIDLAGVPKDLKGAADFSARKPFDFEKWAVTRIRGFAPNTVQRGDGGIDGRALIFGAEQGNDLCIAQVKGGKPAIDALRAFANIIAGGKAAIGVFITLRRWDTPAVRQCIADAGTMKIGETAFNRLVMYSIDDHFRGLEPKLPPLAHPRTGKAFQAELTPHPNR